ncbi:putative DNA helicase [Helianthus annuus]|uniref:DNA helicase n=1 Tax=Helianthus annuus TaxID=4232 RepID=A0A251TGA6_HELAN|nr:putative DNA helicase [Helianthus annuus]KAJ0560843.1 putative DNA helicase [Helianthus annuus]KAJ0567290.1 putative DNA helicase [Helianthus annuus]KAJ0573883.1 putative DNA helicase [Helianthus annuus]KAJ0738219.1 putative DNA helicase [Helianthus annuus]
MRRQANETGESTAVSITVRQLEAIVRLSESLAKMRLSQMLRMLTMFRKLLGFSTIQLDLANGSGRVGSGHGSKRFRVETGSGQNGSTKKGVVLVWVETGSGQNGFGSKRVRVRTGSSQNGFRVGSGWLKNVFFFKVIVHQGC